MGNKPIYLFSCILSLLIYSCNKSNQQKAENVVKAYLKSKIDDPDSYKAVSFNHFDTAYTSFFQDPVYSVKNDTLMSIESDLKIHSYDFSKVQLIKMKADTQRLNAELNTIANNFKKQMTGWSIWHTFRAKNKMGATVLDSAYFEISKDFKNVTAVIK